MLLATFTSPGPVLVQLGPFSLRWYGLLIASAVLLGLLLAMRLGRQRGAVRLAAAETSLDGRGGSRLVADP